MIYQLNPRWKLAKYDLRLIDSNGTVIPDEYPMRTDLELTREQMEDGVKNGFGKYAIPLFVDEDGKEIK